MEKPAEGNTEQSSREVMVDWIDNGAEAKVSDGRTERVPWLESTMALTEFQTKKIRALQADLAQGLRGILLALGSTIPPGVGAFDVCLAYANYTFWRIPQARRRVFRSDTLAQQSDLSPEEQAAIDVIEAKVLAGHDLYPHQSRNLANPLSHDGLLADWQLHHLHLGLASGRPAARPFVNRTRKVLIARFTEEDAYFVVAATHGHGVDPPWWDIDLVEILHRNWRESIARYEIEGYEPKLSWEDHRRMRPRAPRHGCTFTTAVSTADGTSYALSAGLVAAGYSARVIDHANNLMNQITRLALSHAEEVRLLVEGDHRHLQLTVLPSEG